MTASAQSVSPPSGPSVTDRVDIPSAFDVPTTLHRLEAALTQAGMTVFARIDHQAAARQAGLDMPPATVLIYGNPKGGTPLMRLAPGLALDLPLRVLVRGDAPDGVRGEGQPKAWVSWHRATALTQSYGLSAEQVAPLLRSEALIRQAASAQQP